MSVVMALMRRLMTWILVFGKSSYLAHGRHLHIGRGTRLWAPRRIVIGDHVYIGKNVNIEADCEIGDFSMLANRVAIVGRRDHDISAVGFPVRYAPWIGSSRGVHDGTDAVKIGSDVWIGYGAIILSGVNIGRGSVVGAGSVVVGEIPPYCIFAGVPARFVRHRFRDTDQIYRHEAMIEAGEFALSERGYDYCVVKPGSMEA